MLQMASGFHAEVLVDESVVETDDALPGDSRVAVDEDRREIVRGLADHLGVMDNPDLHH